jgi:hypothetical protein
MEIQTPRFGNHFREAGMKCRLSSTAEYDALGAEAMELPKRIQNHRERKPPRGSEACLALLDNMMVLVTLDAGQIAAAHDADLGLPRRGDRPFLLPNACDHVMKTNHSHFA